MTYCSQHYSNDGFTLVELSIVIVIIGLLVGGILVGQDLIHASDLRAVISQQEKIKAAVNAFRTKFNCLPGDCLNATDYGFASNVAGVPANGDGNGIIGPTNGFFGVSEGSVPGNEVLTFWAHITQANLLSGYNPPGAGPFGSSFWPTVFSPAGIGFPSKIRECAWWVAYDAGDTNWAVYDPVGLTHLGNTITLAGPVTRCSFNTCGGSPFSECLTPEEARNIDTKIDDGLPWTGNIHATSGGNYIDTPGIDYTTAPDQCVTDFSSLASPYAPPTSNYNQRCNLEVSLGQ